MNQTNLLKNYNQRYLALNGNVYTDVLSNNFIEINFFEDFVSQMKLKKLISNNIQIPTISVIEKICNKEFILSKVANKNLLINECFRASFSERHLTNNFNALFRESGHKRTFLKNSNKADFESLIPIKKKLNSTSIQVDEAIFYTTLKPYNYITIRDRFNVIGKGYPILSINEYQGTNYITHLDEIIPIVEEKIIRKNFYSLRKQENMDCIFIGEDNKNRNATIIYHYSERLKHGSIILNIETDFETPLIVRIHVLEKDCGTWKLSIDFLDQLPIGLTIEYKIKIQLKDFIDFVSDQFEIFNEVNKKSGCNFLICNCLTFADTIFSKYTSLGIDDLGSKNAKDFITKLLKLPFSHPKLEKYFNPYYRANEFLNTHRFE